MIRDARRSWPEVVFFDAMGTLLHPTPSFAHVFAGVCEDEGERLAAAEVAVAFAQSDVPGLMELGTDRAGASVAPSDTRRYWTTVYDAILETLGIECPGLPERIYDRFSDPRSYALYEDAAETLHRLLVDGRRLGLVSNFEPWLRRVLHHLGIADAFEVVILSSEEGVAKPDPAIYRAALERARTTVDAAVHVGDSIRNDVEPCGSVGLPAVLVDREGAAAGFEGPRVARLRDVDDALGAIAAARGEGSHV